MEPFSMTLRRLAEELRYAQTVPPVHKPRHVYIQVQADASEALSHMLSRESIAMELGV